VVEGRDTVRDLRGRLRTEPKSPEIRIKLGLKFQERRSRDEALALFREAASLDPRGTILTRTEEGASVSCRDMAEFQTARTFVVPSGATIEPERIRDFIKSHPATPLLRQAYLEAARFMDLSDAAERAFFAGMLDRYPHDPDLLARLGQELNRLGERQAANPFFDRAIDYAARTAEALRAAAPAQAARTLAEMISVKGDWEKAESAFGPGFVSTQRRAWARSLLDYADFWMLRKKNMDDALAAVRLALSLRPDDAGIRQSAARIFLFDPPRSEEALAAYGPAWLAAEGHTPREIYDYFSFWMPLKANRESALSALDALLLQAPDDLNFRLSAASVLWKCGEEARAQDAFGPAYAASQSDRPAHLFEYGQFWIPRGANLDTAVPALVKAASVPLLPWMNKWRAAEMLNRAGRGAEAEKVFGPDCLEGFAGDGSALMQYAQYWADRKTSSETVLRALDMIAQLPRLEWYDRNRAAWVALKMGRNDKAEAFYGTVYLATIRSDAPKLVDYAGFWFLQRKNLASALEAAQTAVRIAPGRAEAWAVLADLLQNDGKSEDALQAIQKAVNLAKSEDERDRYARRKTEISGAGEKKKG
jgi:tetratricopeptide (TPR) repeat protein